MKYLDEYRDGKLAAKIVDEIRKVQTKPWVIMEVCGGQTHSIVKHGIDYLLPIFGSNFHYTPAFR